MGEEGCRRLRCARRGARASFLPGSGGSNGIVWPPRLRKLRPPGWLRAGITFVGTPDPRKSGVRDASTARAYALALRFGMIMPSGIAAIERFRITSRIDGRA